MSETIWRATDLDGETYDHTKQPSPWNGIEFKCDADGQCFRYYGTEKPPPGECWEMTLTRKGDIDTDGDPIGWKIVGIGNDGSVLCEKGNGQRRRYSFGDGAKGKPSDEEWERLVNAVADYARDVGIVGPRGERIKEAWKAYEASKPDERKRPTCGTTVQQATIAELTKERDEALRELANERSISDQVIDERNATIAELRSELDETRTERHAYKSRLREFCQRLVDMVGAEGPEDVQGMLDKVNAEINRLKQSIDSLSANLADKEGFLNSAGDEIEVLTKERDEALRELANERSRSGQVTTAQINVIAELRAKIAAKDSENGRLVQERRHWQKQIARQEMPEVVRELLTWFVENQVSAMPIQTKLDAVRDHYAPPFRIQGPGVYLSDSNSEYAVVHRFARGEYLCAHLKSSTPLHLLANEDGSFQGGGKLTKYLRPLEG